MYRAFALMFLVACASTGEETDRAPRQNAASAERCLDYSGLIDGLWLRYETTQSMNDAGMAGFMEITTHVDGDAASRDTYIHYGEVEDEMVVDYRCASDGVFLVGVALSDGSYMAYDPGVKVIAADMEIGAHWSSSSTYSLGDYDGETEQRFEVLDAAEVDVPAGRFKVLRLDSAGSVGSVHAEFGFVEDDSFALSDFAE